MRDEFFKQKMLFDNLSWDDFELKCRNFGASLQEKNVLECEIFLEKTSDFLVAFFGALLAKISPIILSNAEKSEKFLICDKNFASFKSENFIKQNLQDDSYFYLKTSGTSGKSKLIKRYLKEFINESITIKEKFDLQPNLTLFASVSHQHCFGLTFKVFLSLICGFKIIDENLNYPEIILSLDLKDKIFITSPVLLKNLINYEKFKELNKLKFVFSGGSKLGKIREQFNHPMIIDTYGSSETGIIAQDSGEGLIIDKNIIFDFNKLGCLNVKSPWCEFFQTSDKAVLEGRKIVNLTRLDRTIKINDQRLSLEELDLNAMKSGILNDFYSGLHPDFKRISALISLNAKGIKIFRKSGKIGIIKEIKQFLTKEQKQNLRHIKILQNLPRNTQNKISKDDFINTFLQKSSPKWEILEHFENFAKFKTFVSPELFYFDGHFDRLPLIPGFCELGFVYENAKIFGDFTFKEIKNLKFSNFVRPADELILELKKDEKCINFEFFVKEKKSASGKLCII